MFDKVKSHILRHKTVYLSVSIAGISYIIMRGRIEPFALRGGSTPLLALRGVEVRPLAFFSKQTNYIFVTIKQELGRPPYLVHDTTSDLWYSSQYNAAKALGASESTVSRHLNGTRNHVSGHILERVSR